MNKQGAIELSMTTIIVIVIGITILSLGLVWIRSTFSQVGQLTQGAFEQGEAQISDIFSQTSAPVALSPTETSMKQGDTSTATLAINNLDQSAVTVQASVVSKALGGATADNLICALGDTLGSESNQIPLASGQGANLRVIVEDSGSSLGTYACVITVTGLSTGQTTTSLIVNLES